MGIKFRHLQGDIVWYKKLRRRNLCKSRSLFASCGFMFNGSLRDNIIMDSHNTNYIKTTGSLLNDEFEFTRSSCFGLKMNKEGYLVEGPYVDYHKFNRAFTDEELKNLTKIKEMHTQIKVVVIKVEKKQKAKP